MADAITAASSLSPARVPGGAATAAAATQPAKGQGTGQGSTSAATGDSVQLSPEAQREVAKLQARDTAVRAHEAAHIGAGGSLVRSGATYTYERGPDGRLYAIGGEVSIDTSAVPNNPQATITKAEQIEAAALAPVDPSAQDEAVAAQAAAMAAQASSQLAAQAGKGPSGSTGQPAAGAQAATGTNAAPAAASGQAVQAVTGQAAGVRAYGGQGGRTVGSAFDQVG